MEIGINQDIRKFKTKDIGNFSFGEAGFLVIAAGLAFGSYELQKYYTGTYVLEVCILPTIIPILFGFFKPFGLSFYQFLRTIFIEKFLSPQVLLWESDFQINPYEYGAIFGEEYHMSEEQIQLLFQKETEITNQKQKKKKEKRKT